MSEKYVFFLDLKNDEKGAVFVGRILEQLRNLDAQSLLEEYNIDTTPPIDLTELMNKIGIKAFPVDFTEVEKAANYSKGEIIGATLSKDDGISIMYADNIGVNRSRFTVAHELAHCCLHSEELEIRSFMFRQDEKLSGQVTQEDEDANIFAGALLIPKKVLLEYINKLFEPTVEALSRVFQVSENVMRKRLEYLKINVTPENIVTLAES